MALCDVDYVRAHIYTGTLSDSDITAIITEVTEDVLAQCNTTLETDQLVILAENMQLSRLFLPDKPQEKWQPQ